MCFSSMLQKQMMMAIGRRRNVFEFLSLFIKYLKHEASLCAFYYQTSGSNKHL